MTGAHDLLVEIGAEEELPPKALRKLSEAFATEIAAELDAGQGSPTASRSRMPPRAGSRYVSPACPAPSPTAMSSGAGRRSHTHSTGGRALIDPDLLEENTALVEWPVAVAGHFDAAFLALPDAVLTATMQGHQRYFPVAGDDGALMPHFIAVSNIASRDVETVRKGNERVIRPRLSDAAYFFDTDRRRSLESRLDGLEDVVFQHKLGTLHAKAQRVSALAVATAQDRPGALAEPDHALRIEKNMWASCASSHWSRKPGAIAIGRSRASSSLTACPPPRRSATAAPFTWIPRIASGAVPSSRPERPESIPPAVRGEMRADFPVAGLDAGPNPL